MPLGNRPQVHGTGSSSSLETVGHSRLWALSSKGQSKPTVERILDRLDYHCLRELLPDPGVCGWQRWAVWKRQGRISILQSLADHTPDGRVRRRAQEAVQQVQKAIGKRPGGGKAAAGGEIDELEEVEPGVEESVGESGS